MITDTEPDRLTGTINLTPLNNMFNDLIKYEDLLEASSELIMVENATFLRDFGPWKKGHIAHVLSFILEGDPIIQEDNEGGEMINSCNYQLVAIP